MSNAKDLTQLDVNFFRPFIESTLNVLKVQCQLPAKADKPFLKGGQQEPNFDIAGVIGITSNVFAGTITLCFGQKVYLALMSNMLGQSYTEITQELRDGAAELLNIIFGGAKKALNENGFEIQKAIPTVIAGQNLVTTHLGKNQAMVIPFLTEHGPIHIEFSTEGTSL